MLFSNPLFNSFFEYSKKLLKRGLEKSIKRTQRKSLNLKL